MSFTDGPVPSRIRSDFRIGFPTGRPVTPVGGLQAWIRGEGIEIAGPFWERYVYGPESSLDPNESRTELNRVVDAGASSG